MQYKEKFDTTSTIMYYGYDPLDYSLDQSFDNDYTLNAIKRTSVTN